MEYTYKANLIKVIDGDTIDVEVDLGFNIKRKIRLRLADINAFEMKEANGPAAKQLAQSWFEGLESFIVTTQKDPGSYDRYTAKVTRDGDEESLNDFMVNNGGAVPYKYKW